jgi:hypothetical protein
VREQPHAVGTSRIHATISIGAGFFDPGIAVAAAGVAATAIVTTTASAISSGQAPLHLTGKATAEVVITPCGTCVTSLPAGMHMGAVADESGNLLKPARHEGWPFRSIGHAGNPCDANRGG